MRPKLLARLNVESLEDRLAPSAATGPVVANPPVNTWWPQIVNQTETEPNDTLADAKALVRLLKGIPAKINLIPFNPWPGTRYECSDWEQIEKFSEIVFNAGYASPVRTPRGRDILAACGQLKSATEKLSARERMALRAMAMTD